MNRRRRCTAPIYFPDNLLNIVNHPFGRAFSLLQIATSQDHFSRHIQAHSLVTCGNGFSYLPLRWFLNNFICGFPAPTSLSCRPKSQVGRNKVNRRGLEPNFPQCRNILQDPPQLQMDRNQNTRTSLFHSSSVIACHSESSSVVKSPDALQSRDAPLAPIETDFPGE